MCVGPSKSRGEIGLGDVTTCSKLASKPEMFGQSVLKLIAMATVTMVTFTTVTATAVTVAAATVTRAIGRRGDLLSTSSPSCGGIIVTDVVCLFLVRLHAGSERRGSDIQQHPPAADWHPFPHCGVHLYQEGDPTDAGARVSWLLATRLA